MDSKNCKNCSQNDCAYFGMDNKTTCKDFQQIAPAQRTWVDLSNYINCANIKASDMPATVIKKLQIAINAKEKNNG